MVNHSRNLPQKYDRIYIVSWAIAHRVKLSESSSEIKQKSNSNTLL